MSSAASYARPVEVGQVMEGATVSEVVGQLARIQGCRVVGVAGAFQGLLRGDNRGKLMVRVAPDPTA